MTDDELWFWLCTIDGIGRKTIEKLLHYYNNPREIFNANLFSIQRIINNKAYYNFYYSKDENSIKKSFDMLLENNIDFISIENEKYPQKLKHIYDYPYGIFVKGNILNIKEKSIAIVGSRDATSYGLEMSSYFARELAKNNVTIISGLASGIDKKAHMGSMEINGNTVAVLGSGIDICYPKENFDLYLDMLNNENSVFISEYNINKPPRAFNFPMRNRIISGLSDGVFVVEAKKKSGSLITADFALEQGKDVFALPGKIIDEFSQGCNNLIKMGAKLVTTPNDILEEIGINYKNQDNIIEKKIENLTEKEIKIYKCLSLEPKYIDDIIKEVKIPINELLSSLLLLELKGKIKQIVKNYYILKI